MGPRDQWEIVVRQGPAAADGRLRPKGGQGARLVQRGAGRTRARDEPWLWLGQKGRLTTNGVAQMLRRRAAQCRRRPDLHPHLFRHTFAHAVARGGWAEGDLMRLAGWRSRTMLQRYGAERGDQNGRLRLTSEASARVDRLVTDWPRATIPSIQRNVFHAGRFEKARPDLGGGRTLTIFTRPAPVKLR